MLSVLYASETVDGICAASCITRALNLKNISCRFAGAISMDNLEQDLKSISEQLNSALFIVDFPPQAIPNLDEFLSKLSARCNIAYWSFSQPQKEETLATLAKYVKRIDYAESRPGSSFPKDKVSSTELAAYRFLAGDPIGRQLTALAADIKFWLRQDERATKLADLIASGFDKRKIIEALSKGVVWGASFEKARNEYLERKTRAFADLLKRLTIKDYLKYRVGFSLTSSVLSTADACQYILDKHEGVEIAVVVYKSGKIAFRRREGCDLDVSKVAAQFKGGGQKYASGGHLGREVNVEGWEDTLFQLDRSLKDYFLA